MFFVYILRNQASGRYYTGHTVDLAQRVGQHNSGVTKSTKNRGIWELVHHEVFATKGEAMRRERFFKSGQGREIVKKLLEEKSKSSAG